MPRDLSKVIDEILTVIPSNETSARARLESIQNSALFTAPELMVHRWRDAADALQAAADGKEWAARVGVIFCGTVLRST